MFATFPSVWQLHWTFIPVVCTLILISLRVNTVQDLINYLDIIMHWLHETIAIRFIWARSIP